MVYYEDRQTGSIYRIGEVARMLLDGQITLSEIPKRLRPLPHATCLLLGEAEAIAAQAEDERRRWSLHP